MKLENLHFLPIDVPLDGDFECLWPRLPIEGEIYVAQDNEGNIYISFGARGWSKARPLPPNTAHERQAQP